ncbi:ABC transporter permease subunit [Chloroflexia bacterium SDU3-3]|nr:ABC transporter permease subunit [Chloroflexia bacterium SDU3-3]
MTILAGATQEPAALAAPARRRAWARPSLLPWALPLALVALWQALSALGLISARVLPAPLDVLRAALALMEGGQLLRDIGISTQRALLGFALGGGLGFALGLINAVSPLSERLLDSSVQMLRNIPHLALLPLVILWFGVSEQARLFLVALGVFFPLYANTFHGIRTVDHGLIEMGQVYGLSRWALFWHILLPGAMPSILVGVRYGLGVMWLTLIVAETLAANSGIGYITMNAREFMQSDVVVMGIVLYALLGKLADSLARLLERWLLAWHPRYGRA